ncbi:hypothetical protein X946_5500 [Burkholderia sp. ABCPW 111]|nr:hypothetical protein X946_5500 [Burkholderia sp. ABCPW 111]
MPPAHRTPAACVILERQQSVTNNSGANVISTKV